ncbi:UDP-N-acetylglucosamine 1-carboxyvinyltransferase [Ochrobactrum sp. SFR4]|uniref:UDP-N-acetylglucosamine 1-carboxyvinyltransferase n=1 Tax=Ochrobactrum sp. SFR4 TaxID=2717368 RepID=UPI001C8C9D3A|nr:UDP-N-acetylglucosamine 1-carboxyvinyltransferase [Ochrobactrum sp. SFR4]MBX8826628.1 UDP-N-acetylglucosamine 1-carboxyvinyltransferase [Ochrobactrum sp. SFR4]
MDRIKITGGNKLNGIIPISGAKNAALPLMIASLLTDETLTLENMPHLADVELLTRILGNHGADYSVNGRREHQNGSYERTVHFTTKNIVDITAPYELVAKMRASFWVIGPLLARAGEAIVSLPGGCSIGTRPVDLMLDSLTALGAKIEIENGYARATTSSGLVGAEFTFPKVSVGATHVALMAACLAKGDTIIHNAACEPEVVNLAECLNAMGAKIEGAGTPTIRIQGVTSLKGARVRVIPDRIETGTYAMAVAMTGGDVVLQNTRSDLLQSALDVVRQTGTEITDVENGIRVVRNGHGIEPVNITTDPFPGFPTDLQAQFMGLMTKAKGTSHITETIFENRFMHVQELARLGAKISLSGQTATVEGVERLKGAPVMATDLRASATLVIAGLAAEGETTVNRVYHLDRGFERLEEKLSNCGAEVSRISG